MVFGALTAPPACVMRTDDLPLLFYNREAARRTAARMNKTTAGSSASPPKAQEQFYAHPQEQFYGLTSVSRRGLGVRRREPSSDRCPGCGGPHPIDRCDAARAAEP